MWEEAPQSTTNNDNAKDQQAEPSSSTKGSDTVWTYRGYQMRGSEFNTAMVHFYRGEISRSNVWRQRLDATTNWAVITTGAAISVAFSQGIDNHGVIILSTLLVTLFLYLEARRYRYYELWSKRVRLMETDFYAAMLVPPYHPALDWAESLADSLLQPKFPISIWEAFGRRLRRNYIWIYLILALAWTLKIWLHPTAPTSLAEFVNRAAIGDLSGWIILSFGLIFNSIVLLTSLLTAGLQQASGEVLSRYNFSFTNWRRRHIPKTKPQSNGQGAWFRHGRRREAFMVYIITDKAQTISDRILSEMGRGVTALAGTGMYTGQTHCVLISVLTATEITQLKGLVSATDPDAFITVSPAQEVFGYGFAPLSDHEA